MSLCDGTTSLGMSSSYGVQHDAHSCVPRGGNFVQHECTVAVKSMSHRGARMHVAVVPGVPCAYVAQSLCESRPARFAHMALPDYSPNERMLLAECAQTTNRLFADCSQEEHRLVADSSCRYA